MRNTACSVGVYSKVLADLQPAICDRLDCVTGGGDVGGLWTWDEMLLKVDVFGTPQSEPGASVALQWIRRWQSSLGTMECWEKSRKTVGWLWIVWWQFKKLCVSVFVPIPGRETCQPRG